MRFLFIVQGEGRGHMTQAIALASMLEEKGHQIVSVCIGKSKRRKIPNFVYESLSAPVVTFESPNFISDKANKKILLRRTLTYNLFKTGKFLKSLKLLNEIVLSQQPDVIINFYDLLAGVYNFCYRPKSAFWVIGHQYLTAHPKFRFATSKNFEKELFLLNNKLTALNADRILALSFHKMASGDPRFVIIPPLLRKSLFELSPSQEDFILCYMVNPGYAEELIRFGKTNPQIKIEAFWDNPEALKLENPLPNITFHQIDDHLFLTKMAACRGLLSTAGFESICEAMYLGKPVMMVPVAGQYEQACNAIDGEAAGAGIAHHEFDFALFDNYITSHDQSKNQMSDWIKSIDKLLNQLINHPLNSKPHKSKLANPFFKAHLTITQKA